MQGEPTTTRPKDGPGASDGGSPVFRKVALDRLASPEQLDQLLPVTDKRGWVALSAVGVVLLAALLWALLGSIPQNVTGTGILVKSGGVLEVIPVASGQIIDVAVSVGDQVNEGQVVARMAQPDLSARLQQARATLTDLRSKHGELVAFGEKNLVLQDTNLDRQRELVAQAIESAEKVARWTAAKIQIQVKLVDQGLLLKQSLLETREKRQAAVERIGEGKSQLAQIEVKQLELRNRQREELAASQTRVDDAARAVEQLTRELQQKAQIVSPYSGRILEILTEHGMVAALGEPIMRLDPSGRNVRGLEAVIYVPSQRGKQIQPGMAVLIAPNTVKQEEYGLMLARVISVSDFPATWKGMQRVLKNEKLASSLAGSDAPYEVHAELIVDPSTVSQYRWSSSKGPPQRIQSGTLAMANIAVARRRPIELVLPLLRRGGP